jgi:hypothetical protein
MKRTNSEKMRNLVHKQLFYRKDDADNQCKKRRALNKSRTDKHCRPSIARRFRLTATRFKRGSNKLTDTDTRTDNRDTSTQASSQICQSSVIHEKFSKRSNTKK